MTSMITTTRASTADTVRVLSTVLLPTFAGGVIKRRPLLMRLVRLLGGDERAGTVLAATPDPFTPASTDKIGALQHIQPHAVLITRDRAARAERRAANERARDRLSRCTTSPTRSTGSSPRKRPR